MQILNYKTNWELFNFFQTNRLYTNSINDTALRQNRFNPTESLCYSTWTELCSENIWLVTSCVWESHNKTRILEFSYMDVDTGYACMYLHMTHTDTHTTSWLWQGDWVNQSIRNALKGYKCRQSIEHTYTIFAFILSVQLIRPNWMWRFKHMWKYIL